MSESLSPLEFEVSRPLDVAAGAAGLVATEQLVGVDTTTFAPGVVGEGVDIVSATLGHSGNGADGDQKYHVSGNVVRSDAPVEFN
jgi:hypothetical protein